MIEAMYMLGIPGGECFLVCSEHSAVFVDAGFGFCAEDIVREAKQKLGDRTVAAILLTHTHYDHAMGCSGIAAQFPGCVTVGCERAAQIFDKPNARKLMRDLDRQAATDFGRDPGDPRDPYIDVVVQDGQTLTLGDIQVTALATPGHTQCSFSFYFPEETILAASESSGINPSKNETYVPFLVSYRQCLASIERCAALGASRLLIPHSGVLEGREAAEFFDRAEEAGRRDAEWIIELHGQGLSPDEIVQTRIRSYEGTDLITRQPEEALLINTQAMVRCVLREIEA